MTVTLLSGWTADDVPDLTGRPAVVTGATYDLGLETARVLARRGAHVVLTARDEARGDEAVRRGAGRRPGRLDGARAAGPGRAGVGPRVRGPRRR